MNYLATEVAAKALCHYVPYGDDGCGPLCEITLLYSRLLVVNMDEDETLFDIPFERIRQIKMYQDAGATPRQLTQFNFLGALFGAFAGVVVLPEKPEAGSVSSQHTLQLDFADENGRPQTHFFQRGRFGKLIKAFERLKRENSLRR